MDLDEWRSRINNLDNQILHLLNQRAEAVLKIGDLKRQRGAPVYAPEREAEVVNRVIEANAGPLTADMTRAVPKPNPSRWWTLSRGAAEWSITKSARLTTPGQG